MLFFSSISTQAQQLPKIQTALPEETSISFRDGRSLTGVQLNNLDSKSKQIEIQQAGRISTFNLSEIEKLIWRGEAIVRGGEVVIRGGDSLKCGNSQPLRVELKHLRWIDAKNVEISLAEIEPLMRIELVENDQENYVLKRIQLQDQDHVLVEIARCQPSE